MNLMNRENLRSICEETLFGNVFLQFLMLLIQLYKHKETLVCKTLDSWKLWSSRVVKIVLTNLQFYTHIEITAKKNTEILGNFKCFSRLCLLLKVDKQLLKCKVCVYTTNSLKKSAESHCSGWIGRFFSW